MPVDFEIVNIDPNSDGNDDLEYVLTSIQRNGVAIKGKKVAFKGFIHFVKPPI